MQLVHRRYRSSITVAVSLVAMTLGVARPVLADTLQQQRDKVAKKRQQVSIQINLAVASDDAVEAESNRLARAVTAEQAVLAGAESSLAAAEAKVADAQSQLNILDAQSAAARKALVARAVDLYEQPFQSEAVALVGVTNLDDYAQRQAMVAAVQGQTSDVLDSYRQEHIDITAASRVLFAAQATAQSRQGDVQAEEARLKRAQSVANQAHAALRGRIADLQTEIKGLAAQEASLQAKLAANATTFGPAIAAIGLPPGVHSSLEWPVHGPVTREFGYQRGGFHPGIDIAPPYGTPIHASGTGVVIYASWESGYGNYTCINHGGGISTCYGHQSAIYVHVGQAVVQGQVIGAEGSTGNSTGPHVHFEVRVNGAVNNPRNFIAGNP
jgi:murein DD-endopeptidase MepM/ murein hydrolase activator NlpD